MLVVRERDIYFALCHGAENNGENFPSQWHVFYASSFYWLSFWSFLFLVFLGGEESSNGIGKDLAQGYWSDQGNGKNADCLISLKKPKLRRDLIGICSIEYVLVNMDLISQILDCYNLETFPKV